MRNRGGRLARRGINLVRDGADTRNSVKGSSERILENAMELITRSMEKHLL